MSVDYSLEVSGAATAADVADVLARVADATGLARPGARAGFGGYGERLASGLLVQVGALEPDPRSPSRSLGLRPSVDVLLSPDSDEDIARQQDDMVRLTSGLLGRLSEDLVLHHAYEQIWLLRRDGELTVSTDDGIWPSRRLALLTQPYARGTLSFS